MCSKFTVEMPPPKMSANTSVTISIVMFVMIAPVLSIAAVLGGPSNLWASSIAILSLSIASILIGAAVIRIELLLCQYQCAEEMLKEAISRLGWKTLEPFSITSKSTRVLLRDAQSAALWDVSVERGKVICQKHGSSVVNDVVK